MSNRNTLANKAERRDRREERHVRGGRQQLRSVAEPVTNALMRLGRGDIRRPKRFS